LRQALPCRLPNTVCHSLLAMLLFMKSPPVEFPNFCTAEILKLCCPSGLKGTIKGVGKGLGGSVYYPLKGLALSAEDIGLHAANAGLVVKTKTAEHYAGAKKGLG